MIRAKATLPTTPTRCLMSVPADWALPPEARWKDGVRTSCYVPEVDRLGKRPSRCTSFGFDANHSGAIMKLSPLPDQQLESLCTTLTHSHDCHENTRVFLAHLHKSENCSSPFLFHSSQMWISVTHALRKSSPDHNYPARRTMFRCPDLFQTSSKCSDTTSTRNDSRRSGEEDVVKVGVEWSLVHCELWWVFFINHWSLVVYALTKH